MDSRASQLMMRESDVFYDHHPQQVEELQRVEEESKTVDYRQQLNDKDEIIKELKVRLKTLYRACQLAKEEILRLSS